MPTSSHTARQPKGSPTGGQYAPMNRAEAHPDDIGVSLGLVDDPTTFDDTLTHRSEPIMTPPDTIRIPTHGAHRHDLDVLATKPSPYSPSTRTHLHDMYLTAAYGYERGNNTTDTLVLPAEHRRHSNDFVAPSTAGHPMRTTAMERLYDFEEQATDLANRSAGAYIHALASYGYKPSTTPLRTALEDTSEQLVPQIAHDLLDHTPVDPETTGKTLAHLQATRYPWALTPLSN